MSAEQIQCCPSFALQFHWFNTDENQRGLAASLDEHGKHTYQIKTDEYAQKQHILTALPWDFQTAYLECMVTNTASQAEFADYHEKADQLLELARERKRIATELLSASQDFSPNLTEFQVQVGNQLLKDNPDKSLQITALRELGHYLENNFIQPMAMLRHEAHPDSPAYLQQLFALPKEVLADQATTGFDYYAQLQQHKEAVLNEFEHRGKFDDRQVMYDLKPAFSSYFEAKKTYQAAIEKDKKVLQIAALCPPVVGFFTAMPILALFYYLPRYVMRKKAFEARWSDVKLEFTRAARVLSWEARNNARVGFAKEIDELCNDVVPVWRRPVARQPVSSPVVESEEANELDVDIEELATPQTPPPTPARSRARSTTPNDIRDAIYFEPVADKTIKCPSKGRPRCLSAQSFFNDCKHEVQTPAIRRNLFGGSHQALVACS
jgi:hypothetical protein